MATPTVVRRATAVSAASNSTSWTPSFTWGTNTAIGSGDKVLWALVVASDGSAVLSESGGNGWTRGVSGYNSSANTGAIFYKETTAAYAASAAPAFVLAGTASEQFSAVLLAFQVSSGTITNVAFSSPIDGSSTDTDPPSITNSSGASIDAIAIATRMGDSTVIPTVAPSGYSNLTNIAASGTGGASTSTAEKSVTVADAASEDPGVFTVATEQWVSYTLLVWESIASPDVTRALTGQSLTAAGGSVTGSNALPITGQSLAVARGTVVQGSFITGQAVTTAQGSVAPSVTVALTGLAVSAAAGSITAQSDKALTGQAGTVGQGSVAPASSVALTGGALVAAQGTVSVAANDVTVALTGQALVAAQGSLAGASALLLSGLSATVASGTTTAGTAVPIAGQSLAVARGTVTASNDLTVALTGQSLSAGLGSVAPALSLGITGQTATAATGSLSGDTSRALSGQALAAAAGTILPELSAGVSGLALAITQGIVTSAGGEITIALTGLGMVSSLGTLTASISGEWTPVPANDETWSPVTATAETWTPVTPTAASWS